jgi:predicted NBD/HSP70 family sugar kinase
MIIIGGSISNRGDLIEQIYKKLDFILSLEINAEVRPVIEPCLFKNDANLLGALFHSHNARKYLSPKITLKYLY